MKLIKARVQNYRSIEDSGEFEISNLTCLVGKNEAGKTAILLALEAQRPVSTPATGGYDKIRDYPRRFVADYDERHPDGKAIVCTTTWKLDDKELSDLGKEFGSECYLSSEVILKSGYGFDTTWEMSIDEKHSIPFLFAKYQLTDEEKNVLGKPVTLKELIEVLTPLQRTSNQEKLLTYITTIKGQSIVQHSAAYLNKNTAKFFYASHYDRMSGQISVETLIQHQSQNSISKEDQIFLALLNLAKTSLEDLRDSSKYEELKAKCEAASNTITGQIFEYWSQNEALEVLIEFSLAKPGDSPPFNTGTVVRARVLNTNHKASVPFSERSAGFVWFFSFLVKFAEIRKDAGNIIILLDEPGLTLHGKAQSDLLRYIENELLPHHQVLFTTHSPFLIPAENLEKVRIVEDVLIFEKGKTRPVVHGTKVFTDPLKTTRDTLFPLQGAIGYDLCQSLFIGKNTILVEGPSDILYLQALSSELKRRKRTFLDTRWTLCPSGGIDKMQPFISLFAGNHLNVAVLTDQAKGEKSKIEKFKQSKILNTGWAYSIADFTGAEEADIEDLFNSSLIIEIVNQAFELTNKDLLTVPKVEAADQNTTRVIKKIEAAFRTMPPEAPEFDHFTSSAWLLRNPDILNKNSPEVEATLAKAEEVFKVFNELLDKIQIP